METRIVKHGEAVSNEDRNNQKLRIREVYAPVADGVYLNGERVWPQKAAEPESEDAQ